jgi:glucose-1-phosphate thymidylyltransferase
MKIVIPMAGIGSRLKPHTLTVPKPLTLIAGKPIVQRLVEEITSVLKQPVEEIGFIIGPASKGFPQDTEEKLQSIAHNLGAKAQIFIQEEALGTAHAIYQARELLEGNCVVAFADTLFKADFTLDAEADGVIWVHKVDNPRQFGVVKLNEDNVITDFVEKPKHFISDLAIIGIYYFKEAMELRKEIDKIILNDIRGKGGEYQLTDALEAMKNKGFKLVPGKVNDWMDNGNKDVAVQTNAKILAYAQKQGENLVSEEIQLINSTIIPPCYVGKGALIIDSEIGPYVSIGENTKVENSQIKNSLIQTHTHILNARLDNAMIGNNVIFDGNFNSVSLGDFSQLTDEKKK